MSQQKKYRFLILCFIAVFVAFVLFFWCFYPYLIIKQFNNQYIYEYIRNGEAKISDSYIIDFSRKIEINGLYEEDSEKLKYLDCEFIYNITPSATNEYYCTGIKADEDSDESKKIYLLKIQNGNVADSVEINFLPQQLIIFNETLCVLTETEEIYSVFSVDFKDKQINDIVNGISFSKDTAKRIFIYKNCLIYPKTEKEQIIWYAFDGSETQIFDTTPLNESYVAFFENGNLLKFNLSDNSFSDIDRHKLWQISKKGEYNAECMCQLDDNHILLKITKLEKDLPVYFYLLSLDSGNATDVTDVFCNITCGDKPDLITVM